MSSSRRDQQSAATLDTLETHTNFPICPKLSPLFPCAQSGERRAVGLPGRSFQRISAPCVMADMEMTRIKGVHGPRFLHAIVVHDEALHQAE